MIATQLFVVPRSIPMILLILKCLRASEWIDWLTKWGFLANESTREAWIAAVGGLRHGDERGTQHAVVDHVTLLEHRDDGARRLGADDRLHRLVLVRIEFLAGGVDLADLRLRERRIQRFQREIGAGFQRIDRHRRVGRYRLLERILDGEQVL